MKHPIAAAIASLFASLAASAAQNLVVNGSFEQMVHNFPAGWSRTEDESGRTGATWSIDPGAESPKALRIDCTRSPSAVNGPGTDVPDVLQRGIPLRAGRKYTLTLKAKGVQVIGGAVSVQIRDTTVPALPVLDASIPVTSEWREYRFNFNPAKDVPREHSELRFTLNSTGSLWLDDVVLTGDLDDQFSADTPLKFQPRLSVPGTKNLLPNGSFECGSDGWLSLGQALEYGGNVAGLYGDIEAGSAPDGSHAYRLRMGPGLTPESYYDCWPPEHVVQGRLLVANRGWIEVTKGRPYTLSAYLRSNRPGTKGILQLNFSDNALEPVKPLSQQVELTAEWKRYTFTVVAPADSVFAAVGPDTGTDLPSVSTTFWADAIQLEAGDTATAFEASEPVELGFNTGRYGNVFSVGRPIELEVSAHNNSVTAANVTVKVRLTDYWDHPRPGPTLSLSIPPGATTARALVLDLPSGFYRAHFSWQADGREHDHRLQFVVIHPYAWDDSPFGLNHGPTTLAACQQIKQAGVTWVRDWSVNWQWAEPRPGVLSFADIDPHIERLRIAGMNVLSLLPSNPSTSWASEAPATVPDKLWYRLAYAPKDPQLLFNFIATAAARYRSSVTHWEFLNEPLWVPDFCLPRTGGYTIATYLKLLKGAAAAIHRANPTAKVLGGLAIQSEITFGDEFIKAGGLDEVDILNLHPYAGTRLPETFIADMERIRTLMAEHGGPKPIWATETAYYGLDEYPFLPWKPPASHFAANRLLASERQAGDYIVRYSTIMLAYGVEKIFWHEPITGDANNGLNDTENVFIGPSGIPRKSYVALSILANALGPAPAFAGQWQLPKEISGQRTDNVYGYAFTCGDHSLLVAWATGDGERKETWALSIPGQVSAQDIAGAPLDISKVGLSESPVFIISKTRTAGELLRECHLSTP